MPSIGSVYFNLQPYYLTISENLQHHYSFDPVGRFLSGFLDGINYRRGLDGSILAKHRTTHSGKSRRRLSEPETQTLIDDVHGRVANIAPYLTAPEQADLLPYVQAILAWDYARLHAERSTFHAIYKPISILPPDQYRAVVLQAAEGCSWNKCTFCSLYRDRRFRIKSATSFRQHIQHIKQLLGPSIGLRQSLFLGDANALVIPQPRLLELLQVVHEEFALGPAQPNDAPCMKGVYSFLDIFGAERKTLSDYRELAAYGLKRIYIGLESGDDDLFALLNKPGSPQECVQAVQTIKQAGIAVGIILLAGAGGDRYAEQHVANSVAHIHTMGLDANDIIYISALVVSGSDEYSQLLHAQGGHALADAQVQQQLATFKTLLRAPAGPRPKVSLYHIEEFIY
ncbi:MAG: radical SAM protein [Chloroflexaceae bacterium]|nr:radical SAM protein [Chloroflexaceae bacterium]